MAHTSTSPRHFKFGTQFLIFVSFIQVLRPMLPFIAASGLTFYLVSSLQDMGVKCMSLLLPDFPQ